MEVYKNIIVLLTGRSAGIVDEHPGLSEFEDARQKQFVESGAFGQEQHRTKMLFLELIKQWPQLCPPLRHLRDFFLRQYGFEP